MMRDSEVLYILPLFIVFLLLPSVSLGAPDEASISNATPDPAFIKQAVDENGSQQFFLDPMPLHGRYELKPWLDVADAEYLWQWAHRGCKSPNLDKSICLAWRTWMEANFSVVEFEAEDLDSRMQTGQFVILDLQSSLYTGLGWKYYQSRLLPTLNRPMLLPIILLVPKGRYEVNGVEVILEGPWLQRVALPTLGPDANPSLSLKQIDSGLRGRWEAARNLDAVNRRIVFMRAQQLQLEEEQRVAQLRREAEQRAAQLQREAEQRAWDALRSPQPGSARQLTPRGLGSYLDVGLGADFYAGSSQRWGTQATWIGLVERFGHLGFGALARLTSYKNDLSVADGYSLQVPSAGPAISYRFTLPQSGQLLMVVQTSLSAGTGNWLCEEVDYVDNTTRLQDCLRSDQEMGWRVGELVPGMGATVRYAHEWPLLGGAISLGIWASLEAGLPIPIRADLKEPDSLRLPVITWEPIIYGTSFGGLSLGVAM